MTPAGALYGRGLIYNAQYSALAFVTPLLRRIARAMGREVSPAALWAAIVGAGTRTPLTALPLVGDHNARRVLAGICRRLRR